MRKQFFWGVYVKMKEYIYKFLQDFTYTPFLKHILLLFHETRVTSLEYM